jgi:formamidopyrimidine-DNA glycosylase
MFELPELVVLAGQMNDALNGKVIARGALGNAPHKFVWYNRTHEEFETLTRGKRVGNAHVEGRWLFLTLAPGHVLVIGEWGGKLLYHEAGSPLPEKYHLHLTFSDDSFLTATTQMWGAAELYEQGEERNREYIKDMRPTPTDAAFTFEYFDALISEATAGEKRSAKSLLTQDQLIPGLGNAIAQDILFRARLDPRHPAGALEPAARRRLYEAICDTVAAVIAGGGRYDETDLFGQPGGYVRIMDKNAIARPCPICGGAVQKIQYLGGACYFCPNCQR